MNSQGETSLPCGTSTSISTGPLASIAFARRGASAAGEATRWPSTPNAFASSMKSGLSQHGADHAVAEGGALVAQDVAVERVVEHAA